MKKLIYIIIFFLISINTKLYSTENFYNFNYSKEDLKKIEKIWQFNSGVLKDTQNKIVQYQNKLLHLDGYKNLIVLSITNGRKICINYGKKDRAPYRGLSLYKSDDEVYAVFMRQNILQLVNIDNCKSYTLNKQIKVGGVVSPILIHKNMAILLPNGEDPQAYNLKNGDLLWKVSIENKKKKF